MTKEQAIETLESLLLNIAGEKDCQAIELAITALQSDPHAPDWSQAPEWAEWYAIDIFGTECWFENEPTCSKQGVYFASSGKIDYCTKNRVQSLFKRPEQ